MGSQAKAHIPQPRVLAPGVNPKRTTCTLEGRILKGELYPPEASGMGIREMCPDLRVKGKEWVRGVKGFHLRSFLSGTPALA